MNVHYLDSQYPTHIVVMAEEDFGIGTCSEVPTFTPAHRATHWDNVRKIKDEQ